MDIDNWEIKYSKSTKHKVENLKEGTKAKEYRNKTEDLLQVLPNIEDQYVEAAWEDIKQTICVATDNIIAQKPRMVRNGWYDEECKEMREEQNKARLKMLQRKTRNNIEAYREARREARKVCRKKKKSLRRRKNRRTAK
jgi:hypothetical protein